jgi:serine/threonine-protein kinase
MVGFLLGLSERTDMIGSRLGNWVIDKELGRGGMGRVYLAHEEPSAVPEGRRAAIKILAAELAQDPGFFYRFQREIEILSQLDHPAIVRFYESGAHNNVPYYAMEYIEGQNFDELLCERGRLSWKEVLDLGLQVCPALKHAHDRGIVHRDLKPQNLLRTTDGTIKLTDFGIAKVFSGTRLTSEGGVVGTAEFLSPEQAAGKPVTKRSDLYSLGVVLYTLLTGRPPFESESMIDLLHKHQYAQFDSPRQRVPDIPHDLDDVVCKLLAKDPAQRPADGHVLYKQLDSLRRKFERKDQPTMDRVRSDQTQAAHVLADYDPSAGPGPATLMSRLVREELDRQNRGGPVAQFINRPWVLVTLLVLCIGLIVFGFWRTRSGSATSAAEEEPTVADEQAALKRALVRARKGSAMGEGERFYRYGLRLLRDGDRVGAERAWRNLVRAFSGVPGEEPWVELAEQGLAGLEPRKPDEGKRLQAARASLQQARRLRDEGKKQEAAAIWQALEDLYRDDPSARSLLEELKIDRR